MEGLVNLLKQSKVLDAESYQVFINLFEPQSFVKHELLAKSGEYSKKIAFVESGVLRAYYQNDKGQEYTKTFFTEGVFVGAYSSLITGQKNRIDIQCLTDCELLIARYSSFTELFDTYPKIERFARMLAEQFFIVKEKREIDLVMLEARERYALFQQQHPGLDQRIPQYYIASYLGVTATQLSRIRSTS